MAMKLRLTQGLGPPDQHGSDKNDREQREYNPGEFFGHPDFQWDEAPTPCLR